MVARKRAFNTEKTEDTEDTEGLIFIGLEGVTIWGD